MLPPSPPESPEIWSMCSTPSMYLWSRLGPPGIMTLPPTMRGLLDAAFFSHQRLLSSITRAPCRKREGSARPALAGREEGGERDLIVLDASDVLDNAFAVRGPRIDAEGEVSSKRRGHLRLLLLDLLRTSRNSLGPLRSRRLRRCRSSSVADGSLRRSISWPAIARAFSALPVRTPARWALGPCSVAMTDLHSLQPMSAASWAFLSFAFITSNIIGCVLLQVGHQTRENRASTSMF